MTDRSFHFSFSPRRRQPTPTPIAQPSRKMTQPQSQPPNQSINQSIRRLSSNSTIFYFLHYHALITPHQHPPTHPHTHREKINRLSSPTSPAREKCPPFPPGGFRPTLVSSVHQTEIYILLHLVTREYFPHYTLQEIKTSSSHFPFRKNTSPHIYPRSGLLKKKSHSPKTALDEKNYYRVP